MDAVDPMVRRGGRFEREIAMGIPDERGRAQILRVLTQNVKIAKDVDFAAIAKVTPGFVGADLEAVTKEAGLICINKVLGPASIEQVGFRECLIDCIFVLWLY